MGAAPSHMGVPTPVPPPPPPGHNQRQSLGVLGTEDSETVEEEGGNLSCLHLLSNTGGGGWYLGRRFAIPDQICFTLKAEKSDFSNLHVPRIQEKLKNLNIYLLLFSLTLPWNL